MADAAHWLQAAEGATGLQPGKFVETVAQAQIERVSERIDNEPIVVALKELLEAGPFEGRWGSFCPNSRSRVGRDTSRRPQLSCPRTRTVEDRHGESRRVLRPPRPKQQGTAGSGVACRTREPVAPTKTTARAVEILNSCDGEAAVTGVTIVYQLHPPPRGRGEGGGVSPWSVRRAVPCRRRHDRHQRHRGGISLPPDS